jgi:hypothetical protein
MHFGQEWRELLTSPSVAASRKCAKRVAMVALLTCYQIAALRLAPFKVVLPCEFDRTFNGLRPA